MLVDIDRLSRIFFRDTGLAGKPARNIYDVCHRDKVVVYLVNGKIHSSKIWEC
jgi:hypothetical protein